MAQDNLARSGLEVYKTNDKNKEKTSKDTEVFGLQNGTITEIVYFDEMTSNSFEHDYEDISSNGTVSFIEVDQTRFYKGKNASKDSVGIVLALSKTIIEEDNGHINVTSDESGTLFEIKYFIL